MTSQTREPRIGGATLEEVAKVAGVSRATVSRVVNGSPRVSGDARRAVEAAVAELGYVPNRAARSLVTRRSDSIGVVIAEPPGLLFSDPFFPRLLRGISASLLSRDLQLVLLMPSSATETHRTAEYLAAGHVDGALLVSLHDNDPLPARIAEAGLPMVLSPPPAPPDRRELRRRRQPGRREHGRRAPHRVRPAGHRDDRGPVGHGPGHRPPGGLPGRAHRRRPRPRPEPRGRRRLHPGWRHRRDAAPAEGPPRHRRRVRRLGPHGRGRPVRAAPRPGGESPRTSRSSASTTRPSPRPPGRRSPACGNRSRRWATRWPACSSTPSKDPTRSPGA